MNEFNLIIVVVHNSPKCYNFDIGEFCSPKSTSVPGGETLQEYMIQNGMRLA
jgi:hypothetical protein